MDTSRIKEIKIKTETEEDGACGGLEVRVSVGEVQEAFLSAVLFDPDGQEADRILPVVAQPLTEFCMRVSPAQLWNPETVKLYRLLLELQDGQGNGLESADADVAFFIANVSEGEHCLNGRALRLRAVKMLPDAVNGREAACERTEKRLKWLRGVKRAQYNAVVAPCADAELVRLCLKYGLYLISGEDAAPREAPPLPEHAGCEFALTVTGEGVLIENHSLFTNASEYALRCELLYAGERTCADEMQADVPPGSSRYLKFPFARTGKSGQYTYRAALCLKKDTCWASAGEEIASAETTLFQLFSES